MTATEYWTQRFGEKPKYTTDKLACAFSSDYGREQWNAAIDAVLKIDCDTMDDETGRLYIPVDVINNLKK